METDPAGRDGRNVFLGLMRTTVKLGIAFWVGNVSASLTGQSFHFCRTSSAFDERPH
jgi:hypothetical protein